MTDEQVGKYIRLLCLQHQHGHLSENHMLNICKTYDEDIFSKFEKLPDGKYHNIRLHEEILKRNKYCKSRSDNRKGDKNEENKKTYVGTYDNTYVDGMSTHMENENENININDLNKEKPITWKNSFEVYEKMVSDAFDALLQDKEWITQRLEYHPGLDIAKSMEKAYNDFWGQERGWKHKKKSRSMDIDWKQTFTNALTQRMNQVWEPRKPLAFQKV